MAKHRHQVDLRWELKQLRLTARNRWHHFTKPRLARFFLNHPSSPLKCRSFITDWVRLFDRRDTK